MNDQPAPAAAHAPPSSPVTPPTFEHSLGELSRIVDQLEDGKTGLEESLAAFEKGVRLLRTCYTALHRAEQQIEMLVALAPNGDPIVEPFDAEASATPAPGAGSSASPAAGRRPARSPRTTSRAKGTAATSPSAASVTPASEAPAVESAPLKVEPVVMSPTPTPVSTMTIDPASRATVSAPPVSPAPCDVNPPPPSQHRSGGLFSLSGDEESPGFLP